MKVTILAENTAKDNLKAEHGFSLLVEYDNKKILLDTGSTDAFADNARIMNIDLSDVDVSVLSHGHYDHSGGYERFFRENSSANVYVRPQVFNEFWSGNREMHQIGVPKNLLDYFDRFTLILGLKEIYKNVYLVPHNTMGLEKIGEKTKLYQGKCGKTVPDNFNHEQSLVLDTPRGLVIFNSCSHGGAATIIDEAKSYLDNKPVYAYIGGFHMMGNVNGQEVCTFTDHELDTLCNKLTEENIEYIYTGHCTGNVGYSKLKERLDNRLFRLTAGLTFEL